MLLSFVVRESDWLIPIVSDALILSESENSSLLCKAFARENISTAKALSVRGRSVVIVPNVCDVVCDIER